MKLPRLFDPVETRVLGALLEKEQSTPEYYPLTLNALVAACNQKSNRNPVLELSLRDVQEALERLLEDVFVWQLSGGRADRWRHNLDRKWELEPATKAVMTLLLLRGPQTPGELRGRSERLHPFGSTDEVEDALASLSDGSEPLVRRQARQPGQKEARWTHLASGEPAADTSTPLSTPAPQIRQDRVAELEDRVTALEEQMAELRQLLE